MKISKFLPAIFLPFLMFALFGTNCEEEEVTPEQCKENIDQIFKLHRLNRNALKTLEITTPDALAECEAYFRIEFGWEDETKFLSKSEQSPMEEVNAGLKLTIGARGYQNTTYLIQSIAKYENMVNPDGKRGVVWVVEVPAEAPSKGDVEFYVQIQHNIQASEFNFWVDTEIEYSFV